jgi:hypothetical protein
MDSLEGRSLDGEKFVADPYDVSVTAEQQAWRQYQMNCYSATPASHGVSNGITRPANRDIPRAIAGPAETMPLQRLARVALQFLQLAPRAIDPNRFIARTINALIQEAREDLADFPVATVLGLVCSIVAVVSLLIITCIILVDILRLTVRL